MNAYSLIRLAASLFALVFATSDASAQHARMRLALTGSASTAAQSARVLTGVLRDGQTATHYVWLPRNSFMISGTCDGDCSDLDLRLWDGNGAFIDSDELYDAVPVVSVHPRFAGQFRIDVTMADCAINPCSYRIEIE